MPLIGVPKRMEVGVAKKELTPSSLAHWPKGCILASPAILAQPNARAIGHFRTLMEGLTTIRSNFGPSETTSRIEAGIKARGMTVFARIDHAAMATVAGLMLRPTEVIIFGNPRGGTPLMQANQTIGIDLPLKILVWQDASNDTWISYNEAEWLAQRHGIGGADRVVGAMSSALSAIASEAALETTRKQLNKG